MLGSVHALIGHMKQLEQGDSCSGVMRWVPGRFAAVRSPARKGASSMHDVGLLRTEVPVQRDSHSAVLLGGRLMMCGGEQGRAPHLSEICSYNLQSGEWTELRVRLSKAAACVLSAHTLLLLCVLWERRCQILEVSGFLRVESYDFRRRASSMRVTPFNLRRNAAREGETSFRRVLASWISPSHDGSACCLTRASEV